MSKKAQIELPLERHGEPRQFLQRNPSPCVEFGVAAGEIDFGIFTFEDHHKPFLLLTDPAAMA